MKFYLPAIALLAVASQLSVAEIPSTQDLADNDLPNYAAVQHDTHGANPTAEEAVSVGSGTLPSAIIKVASSLEAKLEQRLQLNFDLDFIGSNEVASAH